MNQHPGTAIAPRIAPGTQVTWDQDAPWGVKCGRVVPDSAWHSDDGMVSVRGTDGALYRLSSTRLTPAPAGEQVPTTDHRESED
jgi:hypothetical protein